MAENPQNRPDVQAHLEQVVELLHRHELVENLVQREDSPRHELVETLVHRQHLTALQQLLDRLHSADIAYILEALRWRNGWWSGIWWPSATTRSCSG